MLYEKKKQKIEGRIFFFIEKHQLYCGSLYSLNTVNSHRKRLEIETHYRKLSSSTMITQTSAHITCTTAIRTCGNSTDEKKNTTTSFDNVKPTLKPHTHTNAHLLNLTEQLYYRGVYRARVHSHIAAATHYSGWRWLIRFSWFNGLTSCRCYTAVTRTRKPQSGCLFKVNASIFFFFVFLYAYIISYTITHLRFSVVL